MSELRKRPQLANDVVVAHRITKVLSLGRGRVTWARELIEERVLLALAETDAAAMPKCWSWQKAAETISVEIALAIVDEQKSEPRVSGDEPY